MGKDRVLIVEDDDTQRQVIEVQLVREGYDTKSVYSAELALPILERALHQLVIVDMHLPGMSGIDLLKRIRLEYPETVVIVMTAYGTLKTAVEAMRAGAYDYVAKPVHPYELKMLVKRSLDHHHLLQEVQVLRTALDRKYGFEEIIGSSKVLLATLDIAARIAATDATVLISGETGTGKELVAKAIHQRSSRRDHPFTTINCGAISRELLESELFGHIKGSFTGALTHKKGKVEMADGGTVLLDEVGEMPFDLQVRILRLIQEREIEKVGATSATKVDVRIIAATHRSLSDMVKQGTFREDLYYRLLVVPIKLPALRERASDIEELVQHFFVKFRAKHNRPDLTMNEELMPYFMEYSWPGNVRELENAVERMVLLSTGDELTPDNLPDFLNLQDSDREESPRIVPAENNLSLEEMEKRLIMRALKQCGGNQTQAARHLGLSRRTLAYRLEKYGIYGEQLKAMKHEAV
jgi:DNA-binding NtrC family response regulator